MGRSSDYRFIEAKLRARIGLMHDSSLLENMIKAPTLHEAMEAMRFSRYSDLVDVYESTGDAERVELRILSDRIDDYKFIIRKLPFRCASFVRVLMSKLEIENLKSAIRIWYSSYVRGHNLILRTAYLYKESIVSDIDWISVVNAPGFESLKERLKQTPYYEAIEKYSFDDIEKRGLFDFEIALDHFWFSSLFKVISKLSKHDRRIAEEIYNVDMDLKNILLLIRYGYYHKLDHQALQSILIPYGHIYKEISKKHLLDKDDPIKHLSRLISFRYKAIAEDINEIRLSSDEDKYRSGNAHEIVMIERYLAKARSHEYQKLLASRTYTIGVVLAYFYISSHEDSQIKAILTAKGYGWSEDRIREAVI